MQNDDEVRDGTSSEPKIVRLGPRRATYTPPPRQPAAALHDDEELATALSAGLNWLSTGAIPTVPEQPAAAVEDAAAEVVDAPEVVSAPEVSVDAPAEAVASEPVVSEAVPVVSEAAPVVSEAEPVVSEPEPNVSEPASESTPEPVASEAEPVVSEPTSPWAPEFNAAPELGEAVEDAAAERTEPEPEPAAWESAPPPSADSVPYVPLDADDVSPVDAREGDPAPEPAQDVPELPAAWESAPPPAPVTTPYLPHDEDDDGAVDDPAPEIISTTESSSELPPWATLPAPDPAQAVYLPSGPDYSAPEPTDEPAAPAEPASVVPEAFVPEAWEPRPWEPDVESLDSSAPTVDEAPIEEAAPVVFDLDEPLVEEPVVSEPVDSNSVVSEPAVPEAEPILADAPIPEAVFPGSGESGPELPTENAGPDAEAGVETPPFSAPVRQSLADDELVSLVEDPAAREGGTLSLIEQFEQQLKLREQEAREFTEWESTMLALGTEDAVSEVEAVRSQFTGVIPIIPSAQTPGAGSPEPEPEPEPEPDVADEPEQVKSSIAEPDAEFGEAPTETVDAPEADEPEDVDSSADSDPAPFVAPAWPAWASAAAPTLATEVTTEDVAPEDVAPDEAAPDEDASDESEGGEVATEDADTADEPEASDADTTGEPEASEPETLAETEPEPAAPTLPVWAVPAPTPGWVPPADDDDDDEVDTDSSTVAEPDEVESESHDPVSESVIEDSSESVVEDASEEAVESDVPASEDSNVESSEPSDSDAEQAEAAEPAAEDDSAPWWLNEPVAEGIIAEPQPESLVEPETEPESLVEPEPLVETASAPEASTSDPVVPEAETPTGVLDVAEPLVEPELIDPEEPAGEILEGEVIDDEEPVAELEQGAVPPPFEPPALIEPPGYGAPVPASDEQVTTFTAVAGDTGEVVVAEVLEGEHSAPDAEPDAQAASFVFGADGSGARTAPAEPAPAFEDLLNGSLNEELPGRFDPEPTSVEDAAAEPLFIEPMPVSAGEDVPTDTGSISILDRAYEEELDDDVDETDRAFGATLGSIAVSAAGTTEVAPPFNPPSEPISIVRLRDDEIVIENNEPIRTPVFSIENSGPEPTPVDRRVGHAARLFWLWFAANSSVLSVALGAVIFGLGMSLRQSIVAVLIGVAISFIPLGLSSLAGKRSGQPTMIVSRATFGVVGNILPAAIALLTRLFWGAVLLWLLASSVAIVLGGADAAGALGDRQIQLISLAAAFVIALLVAFAGYPLLARMQLILSIVSGVMIFGLVLLTVQHVDFAAALDTADGSWLLVVSGAVLVFSFVGLVWANSGGDLARYQRPGTSGASSMLWSTFGATLPAFLLIGYGALLAASDRGLAEGFATEPLETLAGILPGWYPIPLLAATALSLLSGVVLSLYSGGFALQAVGVRLTRSWSTIVVGVLTAVLALIFTLSVSGGMTDLFRDLATTIAVPTAAWAGIFAAEIMIRNRRYDSDALLTRGGIYDDVRWVNLVGLLVISILGWGLTTASVAWLGWQGYLFGLFGAPLDGELAGTDVGVLVALGLGLLLPIVAGIPAIRRQEEIRV